MLKHLGPTVTNQNYVHEDKSRLKSGNAGYQSVQNVPSPMYKPKYWSIKISFNCFYMNMELVFHPKERTGPSADGVWEERIEGERKKEVTDGWTQLHDVMQLHNLYSSPSIITEGQLALTGQKRNACTVLVDKPEQTTLRPKRNSEDCLWYLVKTWPQTPTPEWQLCRRAYLKFQY
jgi:hypothetical protein